MRLKVIFSGTVQGVGFRYTTRHLAQQFPITGYVRNCPDGCVAMIAEGEKKDLEAFLLSIHKLLGAYIKKSDTDWSSAPQEFQDFDIRYH